MVNINRIILIVLDSVGAGELPDAAKYGDLGTNTLKHIFEKQVYGLAPTQIIYNIAKNFILGFDKNCIIKKHNLKMCDTLPYAENGTLEEKLDDIYSER